MSEQPHPIIFIVGPTAVGKSEAAYQLAQQVGGEIISCDSMQVYQEINVASNKVPLEERSRVRHHLIDIISVEEQFNVSRFNTLANQAVQSIFQNKHVPIVCGGTGMYMQVMLDGIFDDAPFDQSVRREIQSEINDYGLDVMYERLKSLDIKTAEGIHPHDRKRVVRALEVMRIQHKKFSDLKTDRSGLWQKYPVKLYCLDMDRDKLYSRINHRVDHMFQEGVVDEIRSLMNLNWSQTAKGLIGVKEVFNFLQGKYDLPTAKEEMKKNTRHFAKRQWTWFRKEERLHWLDTDQFSTTADIVNFIKEDFPL
ncbi:MAG: tRNA (adenosine(37)-N6)-dimethylallyltransferase MiaA [Candidatus Omnitrophica bacterium]|nr:tRNA (adenosine(37)-N6)-dimethylallyltransferase MiaA [Candidatus Omnitrophota bacterium]